jgi:hypothetical protein
MMSIGQSQDTYRLLTTDLLSVAPQFMQRRRAMQALVLPLGAVAFIALPTVLRLWLGDESLAEKVAPLQGF